MIAITSSFLVSYLLTFLLIRYQYIHSKHSADLDFNSPQKFHLAPTPRIGGLPIFLSLIIAIIIKIFQDHDSGLYLLLLLTCAIPAFGSGFLEDVTKKINAKTRFTAALISGIMFCFLMDMHVSYIQMIWIDNLLKIKIISVIFTSIMISGLINSYNIIDGFNGLASMIGIISLVAITYVGHQVNDPLISTYALVMVAALAGFFIWNYPKGSIFLGDGGAYLIGFWIAALSIMLIVRNPQVSPWFACLINIYPAFETIFSIWRKKIKRKISPGSPDGAHLHMLIYGRVARWMFADKSSKQFLSNARTAPFLWMLSGVTAIPAALFWNNSLVLQFVSLLFCITYVLLYRSLVLFKTTRWLR